jgi:hypothetical protein
MTDYRRIFEEELGQVVNLKKSVVAADAGPTADHLARSLLGTGVTVVPTTKLIGVGITTSRSHGRQVARARFRKAARRRRRFYALLAAGAYTPRVTASGTNKARLWGSSVLGVTDTDLRRIRKNAASEVSNAARGGSTTGKLAFSGTVKAWTPPSRPTRARWWPGRKPGMRPTQSGRNQVPGLRCRQEVC